MSTSAEQYLPRRLGPLPTIEEADQIHELVRRIQENEPVPPQLKRLIHPGATMGGARPKALLDTKGEQWVIKFSDGEPADTALIEHATMTLARLLRCNGAAEGDRYVQDMRELFRRMVFNILMDNTDDHGKNHALIVSARQRYELSPAYDVLPSGQALGFQQMRVGEREADSTVENALSMSQFFALKGDDAAREVRLIADVVSTWEKHFRACGVTRGDIEQYAQWIDRPFLRDQREAAQAMVRHGQGIGTANRRAGCTLAEGRGAKKTEGRLMRKLQSDDIG